jgi:propanol-preferring alcohol dehydrogenase
VLFAPVGDLVPLILERLRPGGTLAINAIHLSPIPQMPYALLYGERALKSVANATRQDGRDFLRLAAELDLRPTVAAYPLEDANRALADLRHGRLEAAAVLLP